MPTCGSLFSGGGLLDAGLAQAGWSHAWLCESDPWRRGLLAKRFPGAVIYDDIRTLRGQAAADPRGQRRQQDAGGAPAHEAANGTDRRGGPDADHQPSGTREGWLSAAAHVDLIAGGFPCRGASSAGKREGFDNAETVLWHEMRRVIGELRPRYCLIENVANILGMAAGAMEPPGSLWATVVGDLAALGYDTVWDCLPAGAVGAPHLRDRVFAIATDTARVAERTAKHEANAITGGRDTRSVPRIGSPQPAAAPHPDEPWADAHTTPGGPRRATGQRAMGVAVEWGDYQPAITRWEAIHGPAPEPLVRRLDDGDAKLQRLRARMDRQRLSALGDGVHVYLGRLVGEYVMGLERARLTNA